MCTTLGKNLTLPMGDSNHPKYVRELLEIVRAVDRTKIPTPSEPLRFPSASARASIAPGETGRC